MLELFVSRFDFDLKSRAVDHCYVLWRHQRLRELNLHRPKFVERGDLNRW